MGSLPALFRHPIALEHHSALHFPFGIVLGQLVVFLDADPKEPAEVALNALIDRVLGEVVPLVDLGLVPDLGFAEVTPLEVHSRSRFLIRKSFLGTDWSCDERVIRQHDLREA